MKVSRALGNVYSGEEKKSDMAGIRKDEGEYL
jgi:hypothetical protein